MAKVTRIKASDGPSKKKEPNEPTITRKKVVVKDKKTEKTKRKELKTAERSVSKVSEKKSDKKVFILFRPFVAIFRYFRDSFIELRQVRWPNRKATWKMVLAVLVYSAIFFAIISLLDLFFSWLFKLILGD